MTKKGANWYVWGKCKINCIFRQILKRLYFMFRTNRSKIIDPYRKQTHKLWLLHRQNLLVLD